MSHDSTHRAFGLSSTKEATAQQDSASSFRCSHCVLIFKTRIYLYEHLNQVHGLGVEAALKDSGLKSLPQIKPKPENRLKTIKSDFAFNCKHCTFKSVNWSVFNEHKQQCSGSLKNENPRPTVSAMFKEQKSPTSSQETNHAKGTAKSSPKDVKIYSKSPQTITKYFPAAATIKSDYQPKQKKTKTLRLEGSSLKSCGVFQVTATSIDMAQGSKNNSHLLSDLISDPTSAKPVDPFQEVVLNNVLKRTTNESEQSPSKRAKMEMDQPNHTQTSTCAEFSFEISEDEEENDLVDKKAAIIKCKHCDFQSASMEHVYSHYEVNHPYLRYNSFYIEEKSDQSATFRCLECPVEFSSDVLLRNHYSKDHPDAPNIFSLKSEMKLVYKCFVCPFTSSILQSLRRHHKEKHPSHKVENPLLYCKYTSPQHSISVSERRISEEHESPEIHHLEKTTAPCQDQKSPTVSPKPHMKTQDGALYNCVKCSFSHKSVVVLHVHYKKCHPEEPISLDKIKQSVGAPSVTALAQHPSKEVDLSHSFVKKNWASPLSDPENIIVNRNLDNPSSSSVNEKLFFCHLCSFSNSNIKSVISHHNAKHGFKTTIEDVLRHTSMMESKKVESISVTGVSPSPKDLYYCNVCNVGNPSVGGLINHQNKVHGISTSKERILEYSDRIHDQIEKSKSHPDNSILPCGLPLPLIKGKPKLYFCYLCNFRNKDIAGINRHIVRFHKGKVNSQQIVEHTLIIFERLNVSFPSKSLKRNKVNLAQAKRNMAKPRTSRLLGESLPVRLKCFECLYESHHLYLMRKHIINCHKTNLAFSDIVQTCGTGPHFEPGYYCDICAFRCENVAEVKSHGNEKHSRSPSIQFLSTVTYLSPDICYPKKKSNSFENDNGLNGASPQTYPEVYSCKTCSFKGTSFSSITSHYQTVHPLSVKEDDSKKLNLSCKLQKFKEPEQDFDSYQEPLDFDKLDVPTSKPKEYSCPHCPATFEGQGGLIIHTGMKHRDKAEKTPQLAKRMQIFKCRNCSYVNNIRHGVFSHTKMKHPTKGVKCDQFFIDREQLHDVEMKVIHGYWKFFGYICKECSQIYPSKEKLKEHYKTHKKRPALNEAMSAHEGSKPIHEEIWCQFCGLYCASAKELSSHLSVCQKSNSVYSCALCPDAFPTKVQLGLHYTKKHGEKAFFKHYAPLYNQPSKKTVPQNNNLHGQVNAVQLHVFKCPSCRYVNSSFHGTLTHLQMRHPKIVARAERLKTVEIDTANVIGYMPNCKTYGGFRCKKCPLIYRELKKLKKHCEMDHHSRRRAFSQPPTHTQQPPVVQTTGFEPASSQTKVVTKFRHFFKCSLCSFSTPILKTLGRHYRTKHGKRSYSKFYSPLFQQTNKKANSSVTNEQIGKKFEKSENTQRKVVTPQVRVYKCSICSYGTPYRRYLVAHFKNRHKMETKAINKQMEKFKNWESTLPMGRFPCKKCPNMSFVSKGRLLAHYGFIHTFEVKEFKIVAERTHKTTGVYKCLHCKQKIFGIKNLVKHLDAHRASLMKKYKESKMAEVSEENPPSLSPIEDELKLDLRTEDMVKSSPVPPFSLIDADVSRQPSEGRHTCHRCKRTFMSLKGLRSHERSHIAFAALDSFTSSDPLEQLDQYIVYRSGTTRPYMCKLCPYRTTVMALCKTHFLKKHRNISHSAEANKHFQEETRQVREIAPNVLNDLNVDGDEGPENSILEPPDVQRQLKHYTVMAQINPASKVQGIQLSDPRMLPCEMCNFNSQHYANMRRHYLRRHGKKLIRCKDCSFFTCFRQNLELHEQMGHSCVQSEPTHLKNLCCPFCLYQSKNKNNMIDHIVLHRDERMMPIEVRRSKLSRYLQGIVFRCYKCTFTSGSADSLDSHMAKHNDIKPFKCRLCYFDCTQLRDLEAHLCDKHQVVRNHQLVGQVSLDQLEEREDCNSQDNDDYDTVLHNPRNDEALENEQPNGEMAEDAEHPIKENENNERVLTDEMCQDIHNTQSTNGQKCDETFKDPADVNELDENTHDQAQTKAREEISESAVGCKEDLFKVQNNTQSVMADVENQKETSETEHMEDPKVNCAAAAVDSL